MIYLKVLFVSLLFASLFCKGAEAQQANVLDCYRNNAWWTWTCRTSVEGCTASWYDNECNMGVSGILWQVPPPHWNMPQLYVQRPCSSSYNGTQTFNMPCISVDSQTFYCDYNASGSAFGERASVYGYCYASATAIPPKNMRHHHRKSSHKV